MEKRNDFYFYFLILIMLVQLSACGESSHFPKVKKNEQSLSGNEAWDRANDPKKMNYDYLGQTFQYKTHYQELPLEGRLDQIPWSDDYWASYRGGITYRWNSSTENEEQRYTYKIPKSEEIKSNLSSLTLLELGELSPAEKYDLYIGAYHFPLTQKERKRTGIMKTIPEHPDYEEHYDIPSWEGLCHAWAPATLAYRSPNPVVLEGANGIKIPFGSSDIKALLTMFLHSSSEAKVNFLGGRCNLDFGKLRRRLRLGEITKEEFDHQLNRAECRDVNAGAFHLVLTNQIGLMKEGFIADITRDYQVWNQPVFGYQSKVLETKEGAGQGAAPGTVQEITLETTMHYIVEVSPDWKNESSPTSQAEASYRYRLELDKSGNIIGGEWLQEDRPDFLWKQTIPEFKGFFKELKIIYETSVVNSSILKE